MAVNMVFGLALLLPVTAQAGVTEFFDASIFQSSIQNLRQVDFENIPTGAINGDEFAGLTITHPDGFAPQVVSVFDSSFIGSTTFQTSGSQALVASSSPTLFFSDAISDSFDFTFDVPTTAAGLFAGNLGDVTIQFLSATNQILAQTTFTNSNTSSLTQFYGLRSDIPIALIRTIEAAFDADGVSYDDLFFASVPEPGVFILFLLGCLTLFGPGLSARYRSLMRESLIP